MNLMGSVSYIKFLLINLSLVKSWMMIWLAERQTVPQNNVRMLLDFKCTLKRCSYVET